MKIKDVLAMRTGDKINYAGKTAHVVDWVCHLEPVFASDGTRIDAEPVFKFADGLKHSIHPAYWHEISKH